MYIIIPLARKELSHAVGKMCKGRLNGMIETEEKTQGKQGNGEDLRDVKMDDSEKEREKSGNKSANWCCSLRVS
jgi:hypothetical protein